MSTKVHEWEVYCVTESVHKRVWNTLTPTSCPENDTHTISTNPPPRIIQTISSNGVKIIEEDGVTQSIYKFKGYSKQIPSGSPGNVTNITHTFPYPISLINGWFISSEDMAGDIIDLTVAENTVIGAITSPVYPGNSEISVNNTVIDNIFLGYNVSLTDGVTSNDLGEVFNIDLENSKITVEDSASNIFSPLSPTYVTLSVKVIENFNIPVGKERYAFAEKKVGGKYIPSNIPLCIKYTNNSGNAKVFSYNMEYLY